MSRPGGIVHSQPAACFHDQAARELEIQQRIREITDGRTGIHSFSDGDNESVVFGSLPQHLEFDSTVESQPLSSLDLSKRTVNLLNNAGLQSVHDLVALGRKDVLAIRGIGPKATAEIEETLTRNGLNLAES